MSMQEKNDVAPSVNQLAIHDHICLVYESEEQRLRTVVPFMHQGLSKGEQCVYIADENTTSQVLSALEQVGVDTKSALERGSLMVSDKHSSYLKSGKFDPDEMLEFLFEFSRQSKKDGYPALRLTGEMTWALGIDPGIDRLIEYESKLNRMYQQIDALGICQYHSRRFGPSTLGSVIYTHPVVVLNDAVVANPVYAAPDVFDACTHDEREKDALFTALRIADHLKSANALLLERTRELAVARDEALNFSKQKSTFISNLSHELRTPLSGIVTVGELLADTPLDAQQKDLVQMLQSSTSTMLSLLNDVLDLAKIEAGRIELERVPINLLFIVQDTTRTMYAKASSKGIPLQVVLDYRLPELVIGDPTRLQQILANLIGNAVKFTEEGKIRVSLRLLNETDKLVSVELVVFDTGIGMNEQQLKGLFVPFAQSDASIGRRFGGTGLGLTITKQLVEMMHGSISVRSKHGRGTRLTVVMPFEKLPATKAGKEDCPSDSVVELDEASLKGCKILVVEDNQIVQRMTMRQLKLLGADSSGAGNGREALEALRLTRFDAILMDCSMPEMDGFEATMHIRQEEKITGTHVPIIALTAAAMAADAERCFQAGMDKYLAKPATIIKLKTVLSECIPATGSVAALDVDGRAETRQTQS